MLRRLFPSLQRHKLFPNIARDRCVRRHGFQWYSQDGSTGKHDFSRLSRREYWDHFYKQRQSKTSEEFDWLVRYDHLREQMLPLLLTGPSAILDLGCGVSDFMVRVMRDCPPETKAVLMDISHEALRWQMAARQAKAGVVANSYVIQADATALPFRDDSFDLVIDKGTLDSLLKADDTGSAAARMALRESYRVVSKRGCLLQITDEDPELRLALLQEWVRDPSAGTTSYKHMEVFGRDYFMYIIRKGE